MNGKELVHSLEFDNDAILNKKIDTISAIDFNALVRNWNGDLACEGDIAQMQFMAQALFIYILKKAGAENFMNFDRSANHTPSGFLV
jgi:hypothetical protein